MLIGSICAYLGMIEPVPAPPLPPAPSPGQPPIAKIEAQGWLLCDGRQLKISTYPALYGALGNLYGGDAGYFKLPDCRGMFLRGVDYNATIDPDTIDRVGPVSRSVVGGVGSTQTFALETHTHQYDTFTGSGVAQAGEGPLVPTASPTNTTAPNLPKLNLSTETRPVNIGVNYLIRYR